MVGTNRLVAAQRFEEFGVLNIADHRAVDKDAERRVA
jgi:hypothetical protein